MKRIIFMLALLVVLAASGDRQVARAASDEVDAFATIINQIQLDSPVPTVEYLQSVKPLNKGEKRYEGKYQNWRINVTAKESSGIIKSFGISREGNDIIDNLLPIVASVYGDAYQYREKSSGNRGYGWTLAEFKMVNLFYQSGVVRFGGGYL